MVSKGNILISEPYLGDENFERSVILICENNEDGTVGFILNKPTTITLDSVLEDVKTEQNVLYLGGPVQQDSLHFIYRNKEYLEGSIKIGEDLFWGGDYEQLIDLINTSQVDTSDFRFFLGYSGWGEGQLDSEMQQNAWIIGKADTDDLFDIPSNELWRNILKSMGGKYKMYSNYPIDPKLN